MTRKLFGDILKAKNESAKNEEKLMNDFKARRCGNPDTFEYEQKVKGYQKFSLNSCFVISK